MTFPIYGKMENVPNHQPESYLMVIYLISWANNDALPIQKKQKLEHLQYHGQGMAIS